MAVGTCQMVGFRLYNVDFGTLAVIDFLVEGVAAFNISILACSKWRFGRRMSGPTPTCAAAPAVRGRLNIDRVVAGPATGYMNKRVQSPKVVLKRVSMSSEESAFCLYRPTIYIIE